MSPTHHGVLGVTNLNRELRTVLNPNALGLRAMKVGNDEVRVGDRVMFTKNDYDLEVFNGDVGVVHHVGGSDLEVIIKGNKSQIVSIPAERVGNLLRLAYATTVHKAQGQEYNTIIMPMSLDYGSNLLQRPLLYTAVTRAKEKVYLVGEKEAVAVSVSNVSSDKLICGLHTRF
jgi:exodeoxyribonuclease V alpha subunit